MIRRLVQLTVLSFLMTFVLVASVPEKRTATFRLELWLLALLGAVLLVHLGRRRLPPGRDPLTRPAKPEPVPDEPLGVDTLVGALTLASSQHERISRSAHIQLRDALRAAGAPDVDGPLPSTTAEWTALLDEIEAL